MMHKKILDAAALDTRETGRKHAAPLSVALDGTFEGYASLFGIVDLGNDQVMPGAFRASLARRDAKQVRMLWQHDPAAPIGSWLSLVEDARGLKVKGRLNLAVGKAREALALLREGAVDGLSIGFRVRRAQKSADGGVRRLLELDLWEISIVTFPMLPQARVSSLKRGAKPAVDPVALIRRATSLLA